MKQLKKKTFGVVASFLISGMARKSELPFACFNGVEKYIWFPAAQWRHQRYPAP